MITSEIIHQLLLNKANIYVRAGWIKAEDVHAVVERAEHDDGYYGIEAFANGLVVNAIMELAVPRNMNISGEDEK